MMDILRSQVCHCHFSLTMTGGGFIPYDTFVNSKINGSSSEISVGDAVFYIQQSKIRADAFVNVLESLRFAILCKWSCNGLGMVFISQIERVKESPSLQVRLHLKEVRIGVHWMRLIYSESSSSSEEELIKQPKKEEVQEKEGKQEETKDKPLIDLNF